VWVTDDDKLTASRGSGTEVLAQLPTNGVSGTYNAYVNAKHGGHRVEINGYAMAYSAATRTWSHVTTSDPNTLDAGMFSAINGTAHDGDSYVFSNVSFDAGTSERVVEVVRYDATWTETSVTTLRIPLQIAPQTCVTRVIATGACTLTVPVGAFTDAAYWSPYPMFTGAGQDVLLAIDRLDGLITVGSWQPAGDGVHETRPASAALLKTTRTDVYRIPLYSSVPANLVNNPTWSISGRDIYWIAGSEDDREFGVGSFVFDELTNAAIDCKNEYRSNSGDTTRTFGTLLSQPATGVSPAGNSCWGDEKNMISPDRLAPFSGLRFSPNVVPGSTPTLAGSGTGGSLGTRLPRSRIRHGARPSIAHPPQLPGASSPRYTLPDGVWQVGLGGRLQLTAYGKKRYHVTD